MTYFPLDTEIKALTGEIRHYLQHKYNNLDNATLCLDELNKKYEKVSKFPLSEISQHVWDEMDILATKADIKGSNNSLADDTEAYYGCKKNNINTA